MTLPALKIINICIMFVTISIMKVTMQLNWLTCVSRLLLLSTPAVTRPSATICLDTVGMSIYGKPVHRLPGKQTA